MMQMSLKELGAEFAKNKLPEFIMRIGFASGMWTFVVDSVLKLYLQRGHFYDSYSIYVMVLLLTFYICLYISTNVLRASCTRTRSCRRYRSQQTGVSRLVAPWRYRRYGTWWDVAPFQPSGQLRAKGVLFGGGGVLCHRSIEKKQMLYSHNNSATSAALCYPTLLHYRFELIYGVRLAF